MPRSFVSFLRTPAFMAVIARSEFPKRRSNPLNRVAQENPEHGHLRNPKGIATSPLRGSSQ